MVCWSSRESGESLSRESARFDEFLNSLDLGLDHRLKRFGRTAADLKAPLLEPFAGIGQFERPVDLPIDDVNDVSRRLWRRDDSNPDLGIRIGDAQFAEGGDIGNHVHAGGAGDAQNFPLLEFDKTPAHTVVVNAP